MKQDRQTPHVLSTQNTEVLFKRMLFIRLHDCHSAQFIGGLDDARFWKSSSQAQWYMKVNLNIFVQTSTDTVTYNGEGRPEEVNSYLLLWSARFNVDRWTRWSKMHREDVYPHFNATLRHENGCSFHIECWDIIYIMKSLWRLLRWPTQMLCQFESHSLCVSTTHSIEFLQRVFCTVYVNFMQRMLYSLENVLQILDTKES